MSLRECRLAKGIRAKEVIAVLQASGSRVDKVLYSHAEAERVDLNAKDRLIVAKLLDAPYEAVATAISAAEKAKPIKLSAKPNPELRARVSRQTMAQIDKAIKAAGFIDRRDWLMFCIRQLIGGEVHVH